MIGKLQAEQPTVPSRHCVGARVRLNIAFENVLDEGGTLLRVERSVVGAEQADVASVLLLQTGAETGLLPNLGRMWIRLES